MHSREAALRTLELGDNPTTTEIKSAYRRLSLKHHPDKNTGDPSATEAFQRITSAYEALSSKPGPPLPSMDVQFTTQPSSTPPLVVKVNITLDQAFNGALVPVTISRTVTRDNRPYPEEETMYVHIAKGADSGEVILHRGRGNVVDGCAPGDLKLLVIVAEHPCFQRRGLDLFYKKTISLKQALCGGSFNLVHISGKSYTVRNPRGTVITPAFDKSIPGLGMERAGHRGKLLVNFDITFPTILTDEQVDVLSQTL